MPSSLPFLLVFFHTLTIGVNILVINPVNFINEVHLLRKFINNPLIWEPSTSESVINIIRPYRNVDVSLYSTSSCNANIFLILHISLLFAISRSSLSRVLTILPRNGNTPYNSCPLGIALIPAIAIDFAESPSVSINVHWSPLREPAQCASSNFGISKMRFFLTPSVFFNTCVSRKSLNASARSIIPLSASFSINASGTIHSEPKLRDNVLSVSFVWLSNAGLTIVAFTNTIKLSLINASLTMVFFFRLIKSISFLVICLTIYSTCLPPRCVLIPLTKLTCWNVKLGLIQAPISQRSLGLHDTVKWSSSKYNFI